MTYSNKFVAGLLLLCAIGASKAQDSGTRWRLRVMDMQHQVKVDATIRFTDKDAYSCMSGGWKQIVVETNTLRDEDFFPLATPLTYSLEKPLAYKEGSGELTLGRTHVCDGYLFLTGTSGGDTIGGNFDSVGWGRKRLGYFLLDKIQ